MSLENNKVNVYYDILSQEVFIKIKPTSNKESIRISLYNKNNYKLHGSLILGSSKEESRVKFNLEYRPENTFIVKVKSKTLNYTKTFKNLNTQ